MHNVDSTQAGAPLTMDETRSHVEEIIEHAEAAADNIVRAAESEAARYVTEVRSRTDGQGREQALALSKLSETLIAQAEALSRRTSLILEKLDQLDRARAEPSDASSEHSGNGGNLSPEATDLRFAQVSDHGTDRGRGPNVEPTLPEKAEAETVGENGSIAHRYSPGARLLATQMAVAGSGRDEIRSRLKDDFAVADPDPLLDAIIGPC